MNPLLPFKVLVWTGPEYKDEGCSINASIELDLVPSSKWSALPLLPGVNIFQADVARRQGTI
jgi:hypothetical protein